MAQETTNGVTHVAIYEHVQKYGAKFRIYAGTRENLPKTIKWPLSPTIKRVRLIEIPTYLQTDLRAKLHPDEVTYIGRVDYTLTKWKDRLIATSTEYQPKLIVNDADAASGHKRFARGFGSCVEEHCLRRLKRAGVTHARTTRAPEMPRRNQVTEKYRLPIGTSVPIAEWINAVAARNEELGFKRTPRQRLDG